MAIEHIGITNYGGTEENVATDLVGTDNYQAVKIMLGADGAADNLVDAGSQASSASLPVTLSTEDVAIVTALKTALEIIDDWDASDHCNIRHLNATDDVVEVHQTTAADLNCTEASASAMKTALEIIDDWDASDHCNIRHLTATDDVVAVTPGVAATSLGKAEDAGHTSGDVGVMALAVRNDTPAALATTTADYIPLTTNKLGSLWVQRQGATPHKNIDCDETEDAVSANPCLLMGFYAYCNAAAGTKRYLKLYNNTVAGVTVGTTVPDMTFELDGGQGLIWSTPLLFATALTVAATTAIADNDSGAPAANDVVFNCGYTDL